MHARVDSSAPIGLFDSGPGGLAVLQQIQHLLPAEDVLYLGDTARQPYGPRPMQQVCRYAVEITGYLLRRGVKMVLIGCNTASAAGAEAAQRAFPHAPVLGMLEPGTRAALAATRSGRIGVWGTEMIAESRAYDRLIKQSDPRVTVASVACPTLLRLAEKGEIDDRDYLRRLIRTYFEPLADLAVDTLLLGCTDLTCVRSVIDEVVGQAVTVVDPAEEIVRQAQRLLEEKGWLHPPTPVPHYTFLVTGENVCEFAHFAARFLGVSEVSAEHLDLAEVRRAGRALGFGRQEPA